MEIGEPQRTFHIIPRELPVPLIPKPSETPEPVPLPVIEPVVVPA